MPYTAKVLLVGMPDALVEKARQYLVERHEIEITGVIPRLDGREIDPNGAQVAVFYAASDDQLVWHVTRLRREGMQVIACIKGKRDAAFLKRAEIYQALEPPATMSERDIETFFTKLLYQVRSARLSGYVSSFNKAPQPPPDARGVRAIAIGASAGGTHAIERLVCEFPENFPSVLIVQHMARGFTEMFIKSLSARCRMSVRHASDGEWAKPGVVYVAPWGKHMTVADGDALVIKLVDGEKISGHRPSVDALFSSMARAVGSDAIGVILTGMGKDGAKGLLEMRNAGALTIGQDEKTSAVYGMPMEAYLIGAVERQLPLDMISGEIKSVLLARRRLYDGK